MKKTFFLCVGAMAAGPTSYTGNGGLGETGLAVSPYFTATLDRETLPVYATPGRVTSWRSASKRSPAMGKP